MNFSRPKRGDGRLLLGVCAGLARRWDLAPRTVRFALGATLVPFGAGLLVYAALALVMPADGASDAEAGWRGAIGRSIAEALVVLAAVLAVGLIASIAVALAVFGLGSVALLLATAALAGVILSDHERAWLLGVAAFALALPAAAVELTDTTIARQVQTMRIAITRPQDAGATTYRTGMGSMLLDLREFDADERTTTTIRGHADVRPLVVALPTDRCFNLEVHYALDRSWLTGAVFDARRETLYAPSAPGYPQSFVRDPGGRRQAEPSALVAYGRSINRLSGLYRRPGPSADAPTIRLELTSSRSQIHVRDYPMGVDPLATLRWPDAMAPSLEEIEERGRQADLPDQRQRRGSRVVVDPASGAVFASGRAATGAANEAIRGLRERDAYPTAQARKLAGACPAASEVRSIRTRLRRQLVVEEREYIGSARRSEVLGLLEYMAAFRQLSGAGSRSANAALARRFEDEQTP